MNIKRISRNGVEVAVIEEATEKIIADTQTALDLMATVRYETDCDRIAISKSCVAEDFFVLSTRIAGEVLQKFVNYHCKLAIFGDFSHYTSKPLRDFIYESNNGSHIFFTATEDEAIAKLAGA
jgi:hypothetical protein